MKNVTLIAAIISAGTNSEISERVARCLVAQAREIFDAACDTTADHEIDEHLARIVNDIEFRVVAALESRP